MAKTLTTAFVCQSCGEVHSKWSGKCNGCGEWNTLVEEAVGDVPGGLAAPKTGTRSVVSLPEPSAGVPSRSSSSTFAS